LSTVPIRDPSYLEGKASIPTLGDPTLGGADLISVNGQKLKVPTKLQAGPSFMFGEAAKGPDAALWASDLGIIRRISNMAKKLSDKGYDPYLNYVKMGGQSPDYSHHMTDTLVQLLKQSPAYKDKEVVAKFDDLMRKGGWSKDYDPYVDWPGLRSKKLQEYLYETGPGKSRTAMAKLMAGTHFKDTNMPYVPGVRFAVSEPSLMFAPNYSSGHIFGRVDPRGRIIENQSAPHKTYAAQIAANPEGADIGRLAYPVPLEVAYKDWVKQKILEKGEMPSSRLAYTFGRELPPLYWTPETVDRVGQYLNRRHNLGFANGGEVDNEIGSPLPEPSKY